MGLLEFERIVGITKVRSNRFLAGGISRNNAAFQPRPFSLRLNDLLLREDHAVQIHAGCGFIKDYIVEKLCCDQRVTEIYEGPSEVQRLVIARSILGK